MSIFKCKMCGGTLEINEAQSTAVCEYCGTVQTLPKLGNEQRENLYDRANHFAGAMSLIRLRQFMSEFSMKIERTQRRIGRWYCAGMELNMSKIR